jgi:hypothetical protein
MSRKVVYELEGGDVTVHHETEEYSPDKTPSEMRKWIRKKLEMNGGEVLFEELYDFMDSETGIRNLTRFTVQLKKMIREGDLIYSRKKGKVILF